MAERALIAAIMLDEYEAWTERVDDLVTPAEFFTPEHRGIYAMELALARHGIPVTVPTIAAELSAQGLIDEIDRLTGGTEAYLFSLTGEWMLSALGCEAWAKQIHEYALRREQITYGAVLMQEGYAGFLVKPELPLYERPEYQGLAD